MWTFIKSLFGSKKAEQVQEVPYKVEAPVVEAPAAAPVEAATPVFESTVPPPALKVEVATPAPAEKKPARSKSSAKNTGPYPFPKSAPAEKAPKTPKTPKMTVVKSEKSTGKKKPQKKST